MTLLFVALLVLCGYAQRIYLEKALAKKYAAGDGSVVSSGEGGASDRGKEIELLKAKNRTLQDLTKEKNRQIEELRTRLYKVDAFFEDAGENGLAGDGSPSGSRNVSFTKSTRMEMAERLQSLVEDLARYMDEEQAAEFTKAFNKFIEDLKVDESSIPVSERRANLLNKLQEDMAGTQNEYQKRMIQKRIDAINNASEEDLPGILAYYQKLDDIQNLNQLMREFNIGRDELISAGMDPPPRSQMGPDPLELAVNLDSFADAYTPFIPQEKREQFTEQVADYLDGLTRWRNSEEIQQYKEYSYNKTQAEYQKSLNDLAASTGLDEQARQERINRLASYYEKQLERIQDSSDSRIRRMMQFDQMGELRNLLGEYDIPSDDLREYGVMIYGPGGGGWSGHGGRH